MKNPNPLDEPTEAIPKENPVIPDPNQVVDVHDPNKMVDIPDDVDLVDYDGDDEENPEEDPEEYPKEELEPIIGFKGYELFLADESEFGLMEKVMDWLSRYDAAILCGEKKVRIPLEGKMLVIEAQVTEQESKEKQLEDVLVIRDFPEVFLDELPGLPPP
ncbi:hypothetical protein Tco_0516363 [Tanacetum coccineum]